MLFRQLFDRNTSTYTYLLADEASHQAILIDPVVEHHERDLELITELGLTLLYVLETHVHADHVTGASKLRQKLGAKTAVGARGGANCADIQLAHGQRIVFGAESLEVRETPGHTNGCVSYVDHNNRRVFTGDTLLIRGCGRTDFQQGSSLVLFQSVQEQLFTLPADFAVYPGHDYKGRTSSSIGEELRLNPRLGGSVGLERFQEIMAGLGLAYPAAIDRAVPANLRCGEEVVVPTN